MIEYVTENNPNFAKERALTATETIDLAKNYGLAIYAPHPSFTFTGAVAKLENAVGLPENASNLEKERTRIAQLVQNRGIGMSIHNAAYDDVLKILDWLEVKTKIPISRWAAGDDSPEVVTKLYDSWGKLSNTPLDLLRDSMPEFHGGGNDAHLPEAMINYLEIPIPRPFNELSVEEVYEIIIHNKDAKIVRTNKKGWGWNAIKYNIKTLSIVLKEKKIEDNAAKLIEEEKQIILEAYVMAHETGCHIEDIMKIKGIFPGQHILTLLSKSQLRRIQQTKGIGGMHHLKKELENIQHTLPSRNIKIIRYFKRMRKKTTGKNLDLYLPLNSEKVDIKTIKTNLIFLERNLMWIYHAQESIEKSISTLSETALRFKFVEKKDKKGPVNPELQEIITEILDFTKIIKRGHQEEGGYRRIIENIQNLSRILSDLERMKSFEEIKDVLNQWRQFAKRNYDEEALLGFNRFFKDDTDRLLELLSQKEKQAESEE